MKTLLLAICCFAGTLPCAAQDKAMIPYEKLYGAFQKAAAVKNKDVRAFIAVVPKNSGVKPGDVTFTVQARGGPQKLPVDPDGELHGLPMSAELLKENPPVATNQPKGSLGLGGGLAAILPDGTTFTYQQLGRLVDAGSAEIKKQAGLLSLVAPAVKSLNFVFFTGGGQKLTVNAKAGPKTIPADAKGQIVFVVDPALLPENPTVVLSEKPAKAILDF